MKIHTISKGPMVLTGSKVLKLIMDKHTPPIDLFTREVIQNCADAILPDKSFGRISFTHNTFDINGLIDEIGFLSSDQLNEYFELNPNFLAISDRNTCGLLGRHIKSEDGTPNNLFNLVYDVMNTKDDENAGGSWGVGKSIYYRYGRGLAFYYSRTYENDRYISKLAGALIQNEKDSKCLLGNNTSGIAFFGDIIDGQPAPIYDEEEIEKFLKIFNLQPYIDDSTGTIVIIPFINEDIFLDANNNKDDDTPRYWLETFESCLELAIQRWYFPRLNNEKYLGKQLKIAINNKKIELNVFYDKLQKLYNCQLEGSNKIELYSKKMNDGLLGYFSYKLFDASELGVHTPPINLPSPRYIVDSNIESDEKGLLFYTRKPGMIINYDNNSFGSYSYDEEKFLIGIFVLNDELEFNGERLGSYVRATEAGNHAEWLDSYIEENPLISKKKPIKEICSLIKKHLNEVFKQSKAVSLEGSNTILQKKLGEKLMPPSGFGQRPDEQGGGSGGGNSKPKKSPKISFEFLGLDSNGYLNYNLEFNLKAKQVFELKSEIKAGGKSYSFEKWHEFEFEYPCKIVDINIYELFIDKIKQNYPQNIVVDEFFSKKRKKVVDGKDIYKIRGYVTEDNCPFGFSLMNAMDAILKVKIKFRVEIIDNKFMIGFDSSIKEGSLNEK